MSGHHVAIGLLLFCWFCTPAFIWAQQDTISASGRLTDKELLAQIPMFSIYGDNYFITGTDLRGPINSDTSDAKFQLGFKQMLTDILLPYDAFLFFTYRQKSFWDIYKDSFPFRETNYNPGLGVAKIWFKDNKLHYGLWFQFEHESNGRDGLSSRSWNFLSLRYSKPVGQKWQLMAKSWVPIGSKLSNQDLLDYRGYFQFHVGYKVVDRLILEGDFSKAFTNDWRGNAQIALSWKPFKKSNQFLYLQYYVGQAENLIEYQDSVSKIRIGVAFKELFGNFDDQLPTPIL